MRTYFYQYTPFSTVRALYGSSLILHMMYFFIYPKIWTHKMFQALPYFLLFLCPPPHPQKSSQLRHCFGWIKDTSQFNEGFIKNDNEESYKGYFLEVHVQYIEKLHELHNDLPLLPKTIKLEKVEKLEANLHVKIEYVIHIMNLKQALNHKLFLKKVHRAYFILRNISQNILRNIFQSRLYSI